MSGEGLVIANLLEDSAAAKAGLEKGDKVVQLNDKPVDELDPDSIRGIIGDADVVNFSIIRKGEQQEIPVRLEND